MITDLITEPDRQGQIRYNIGSTFSPPQVRFSEVASEEFTFTSDPQAG